MILLKAKLSLILVLSAAIIYGQVTESSLSSGIVYKMTIPETGIYKIDHEFLSRHSINISSGQKIHVFGQKGGPIPESLKKKRTDDLEEFPLLEFNVESGPWSNDSYILFYAEGASSWNNGNNNVAYQKNVYDNNNYVFLVLDNLNTRTIEKINSQFIADFTSSAFDEFQRFEEDKANPLGIFATTHGSGQEWYGDEFSNLREKDYSDKFDFTGIDLTENVRIKSEFVSRSSVVTNYQLYIDDHKIEQSIGSVRTGDVEAIHARKAILDQSFLVSSNSPTISIKYPSVSVSSKGWIDFIQVQFRKQLVYEGVPLILRDLKSTSFDFSEFNVSGITSSNTEVWDITDPENPVSLEWDRRTFSYPSKDELRSFIIFDNDKITTDPEEVVALENQNLHGIIDADMIIVYDKKWKEAAEELADHRRQYSELMVETVEITKVYNEFSSGRQDPSAIRDFAKMIRDRSENFRYLLLFGDGSYDFRGINENLPFQSFIPTYETKESLDPLDAFPSDDYFAQLDDNEGVGLFGDLDIAVGRLPARSPEEALNFVNKIISYDISKISLGEWRSRIAFLADDEDSNLHLNDADVIAKKVLKKYPLFNQKKIYWDAYKQESTPGGNRYPAANVQLNSDVEDGLLVLNYLGHGGPKGWSQERVLNLDDITSWSNLEKLPLVITATCSFTGFDDPSLTTAGEACIHNPSGGAVALFTTVRSVYASQNFRLTEAVFDTLFTTVDGDYMTIGEVMQRAKNTRIGDVVNARKFFLIGDPAMKLAIPKYKVETNKFNDRDIAQLDTIGARQEVKACAIITDDFGNRVTSFNGVADITLFDKPSEVKTLRNDPGSFEKSFEIQKNILFSGQVSVEKGAFDISFIVPLDINYEYGNGRLSYYAVSDNGIDAAGFYDNFIIGGTAENAISDTEGPEIIIKLNDKQFSSEDKILKNNPLVLVEFYDDSGINISNVSIGHEIVGILDDDTKNTQVLNEKYSSDVDNFQRGSLSYRLEDLEIGSHTLTIRAFDVFNNAGISTIEFEVIENLEGLLQNVSASPNPFEQSTQFYIENELGGPINLNLKIFDIKGQKVEEINANGITNDGLINNISWDGSGPHGPVSGGLYFYEVTINDVNNEKSLSSGLKKIIVLK